MVMHALLLQRPVHSFHNTVLLHAMWSDELLRQAIAATNQVVATGERQTIVRSQQESRHRSECAGAGAERLLQAGLPVLRQVPA